MFLDGAQYRFAAVFELADRDGALWFTNNTNNTIGRITTSVTPQIFRKSPTSGVPGTQVTISGSGFGAAQGTGGQHAKQAGAGERRAVA